MPKTLDLVARCLAAALLALLVGGCPAPDSAPPPSTPAEPPITLLLDGRVVARFEVGPLVARVPLTSLLPAAARDKQAWRALEARSEDKRRLHAMFGQGRYADQEVFLYRDDEGRPSVGFFRRDDPSAPDHVRRSLARPTLALVLPATIEVRTQEVEAPPRPELSLEVRVEGGAPKTLTRTDLERLPESPEEGVGRGGGQGRRATTGWRLADVLGLCCDVAEVEHVRLHAEGEDAVEVEGDVVRDERDHAVRLKLNRRGEVVVTTWDLTGEKPVSVSQVRGLRRIEVVLVRGR